MLSTWHILRLYNEQGAGYTMENFSDATEITMRAYQAIASGYGKQGNHLPNESFVTFWKEHLQRFVALLQASPAYQSDPSLPVLDAGCGTGRDSISLARMGLNVIAADLSPTMLAEARQRLHDQPGVERITFRCMDMHALELADASCAGVLASASFLHIPKRENLTVLNELVRVLAPGGPLLLLVKESDGGADERYDLHEATGTQRFYARYRGGELWDLLEQAHLRVLEMTTTIDYRFPNLPRWLCAQAVR
jgi:ubiquinone/menaquinone biosynthesis C-methylase UbiE